MSSFLCYQQWHQWIELYKSGESQLPLNELPLDILHKVLKYERSEKRLKEWAKIGYHVLSLFDPDNVYSIMCCIDIIKQQQEGGQYMTTVELGQLISRLPWKNDNPIVRKSLELYYRIIQLDPTTIDSTQWIHFLPILIQSIHPSDIDRIVGEEYTEFYHSSFPLNWDRRCIQWYIFIGLQLLLHAPQPQMIKLIQDTWNEVDLNLVFDICCTNDNDLVTFLHTILLCFHHPHLIPFLSHYCTPHTVLSTAIDRAQPDPSSLLIDLLLDPTTSFYSYLISYLDYALQTHTALSNLQSPFHLLKSALERGSFGFNPTLLIDKLDEWIEMTE
ncbi:hypothetical protein BDB01DRAFT_284385 [Pilobolus umbonatus]|nr:hypothetical protein BDB01DRAFT_284385 [Pilobolus umbonatus]